MQPKVVVTGMGVVSPLGNDVSTFWEGICQGRSGIRAITRFDTEGLTSKIAGMVDKVVPRGMGPKDLRRESQYSIYALEATDQAIAHAGLDIQTVDSFRCGTIIGSGIGGLDTINLESVRMNTGGPRRVSPMMIPKGLANMASGAVAIRHGFNGPNKAIVTACASGTQCIGEAADTIRLGKADVMIAGGAEATVIPFAIAGFCSMRALSTRNDEPQRASRPFDADRNGFIMGEGAGVLILESEEHAKKRGADIIGEVAGMGETCDAYHITAPLPDGSGAAGAMKAALNQAASNPEEIDYYNAHGTSTKLNDAGECKALRIVFGENSPPASSIKSMIGHLLGAAGAVEAIVCLKAIQDGVLPPNINYENPDPQCVLNIVANEARQAPVSTAMSTSLGFGGHNACVVFRRYAK